MKKILYIVCCCLLSAPVLADYWRMGSSESCFVHANADGSKDVFYYCGDQKKGCAGNNDASYDSRFWQGYGGQVPAGSGFGTHWCCDGKYIKATENYETNFEHKDPVTISVTGGTCTYEKITNACGDVVSDTPCTEATDCANDYIKRNGVCIKSCQDEYAFESDKSNNCIECKTTLYSGINEKSICEKCDKDLQFFNKITKKCVDKNTLTKYYPSEKMAKCFMCGSKATFMQCLAGDSTGEKNCPIE